MSWQQRLYSSAPWAVRELLVAVEARRRNRYRRYGRYAAVRREYAFDHYYLSTAESLAKHQLERVRALLAQARKQSSFYQGQLPASLRHIDELAHVPILGKHDNRSCARDIVAPDTDPREVWQGLTSGSTGTPLAFSVGREGIRARYAIQDNYYEMHGCRYGERRVRFGGAKVVPVSATRPPFWILNRPDNQLQMSAYHIDADTLPHYKRKLEQFCPRYVTGYAHAQYQVAQYLRESGGLRQPPRALFTDSEGAPPEHREVVEAGFGAPCYDVYGLGEVGWVAVQCRKRRYHVLQLSCILEVVDDSGHPVLPGRSGRLVVTDLTQSYFPYIRYETGDIGAIEPDACDCGLRTDILKGIEGRSDELIVTPRGRRVGRLSHVTKPGRGIRESQIAQTHADRIVIRVVPGPDFEPASMAAVVQVAHELLGDEMRVDWERVESIARTNRHKFKHVVREWRETGAPVAVKAQADERSPRSLQPTS
jgi:phenylacetate-CoA ligase